MIWLYRHDSILLESVVGFPPDCSMKLTFPKAFSSRIKYWHLLHIMCFGYYATTSFFWILSSGITSTTHTGDEEHQFPIRGQILKPIICVEPSPGLSRKCDADDKLSVKEFWRQFDIKMYVVIRFPLYAATRRNAAPVCNKSHLYYNHVIWSCQFLLEMSMQFALQWMVIQSWPCRQGPIRDSRKVKMTYKRMGSWDSSYTRHLAK
jgi:hypothetical protein